MEKMALNLKEVASMMGVCLSSVRKLCDDPSFPAIRVSPRRIVVPVDAFKVWLSNNADKRV